MKELTVNFKKVDLVVLHGKSQEIHLLTNVRQAYIINTKDWWRKIINEFYIIDVDDGKKIKKDVELNNFDDYFYIGDF